MEFSLLWHFLPLCGFVQVAEEFCEIISRSEEAQYAPSTDGEMGVVYAEAIDVISKIEDVVKR